MKYLLKLLNLTTIALFVLIQSIPAQSSYQIKIMSWNTFDCSDNFNSRLEDFNRVLGYNQPDILVVEEIASQTDVNSFLTNALIPVSGNYKAGTFIGTHKGNNSNAIFFDSTKFSFVSNEYIETNQRDINKFTLSHKPTEKTFHIYSLHLKSNDGDNDSTTRATEVSYLISSIQQLNGDKNYIVVGDFNFYRTSEPGYRNMTRPSINNYLIDPVNSTRDTTITWADESSPIYARLHSLATSTNSAIPGYACNFQTTGLLNRFDYIFMSPEIFAGSPDTIVYDSGSYNVLGQDGQLYKKSITQSSVIPLTIADALLYASDHLPVYATFTFSYPVPVELVSFTAQYVKKTVQLYWNTATEVMNYGFDIERSVNDGEWNKIGFVNGFGNSNVPHDYTFEDEDTDVPGHYKYRLKQIDTDGKFEYSPIAQTEVYGPDNYTLSENYPNPFNPTTSIDFQLPVDSRVTLKVLDVLGREVAILVDGQMALGKHKVIFDGSSLSSGIYIYQLRTDNKLLTRKMMLLK